MDNVEKKPYTIGLDIGTNSVGWAVVCDDHTLVSRKMKVNGLEKRVHKNFWGVRLFDEGKVAKDRRLKRTTRRRIARRRNRIKYLQDIFSAELAKVDESFLQRLGESFLKGEDTKYKFPLFPTRAEEQEYHEKFQTIYHLRNYLMETTEKADLRYVYLALHHIIKFRGHFLIEGNLEVGDTGMEVAFKDFIEEYKNTFLSSDDENNSDLIKITGDIKAILTEESSRTDKAKNLFVALQVKDEKKDDRLHNFLKLAVGNKVNFKTTFDLADVMKLQISSENFDEELEGLLAEIGDEFIDVFSAIKTLYNAIELYRILGDKKSVSEAMIDRYENHESDLKAFKNFVKAEKRDKYEEIFKDEKKNGYAGYISRKTSQEEFYKYDSNPKTTQKAFYDYVSSLTDKFDDKIEKGTFLRKQRTFDNGIIPHQLHWAEAELILKNQGEHYPFLKELAPKIKQIFEFRIPYYVGPLASKKKVGWKEVDGSLTKQKGEGLSGNSWLVRKSNEKIRPWNWEDVVDVEKSAINFIERMTNFCTYLPKEKVLPSHSLLYEKYTVFNELTKVKFSAEGKKERSFDTATKLKIFEELFKTKKKVSEKDLKKFLECELGYSTVKIFGLEKDFNASYGTYNDFLNWGMEKSLLDDEENIPMLEDIIKILTIFEDKEMRKNQLEQYKDKLSLPVFKKLCKKHYTGWGRVSKKLLDGIRDEDTDKSVLDFLIDDEHNRNLMQLINEGSLSFKGKIEKEQLETDEENLTDVVYSLAGSLGIKKGILQSLKVVKELVEIMGYSPARIIVEMARENMTTKEGKRKSRPREESLKEGLKKLKDFKEEVVKCKHSNDDLKWDKLYLYYLQNGKDMYTGKKLEIERLSEYDRDHIIPQSFITDNSIDNLVLTSSSENRGKSDDVPSAEVVDKRLPFWNNLHKSGLISERKLANLKKGELSEDDKAGFIKRQLVETRQITKHVARILNDIYHMEGETEVITLKSSLTSQFRKDFKIYKVREVNDYHHAHDAYLNCVVANTLLKVYPKLKPELVYSEYQNTSWGAFKKTATEKKNFYSNIMRFFKKEILRVDEETGEVLWNKDRDIATVKKTLEYKQMNVVKKTEIQKGEFSKDTVHKKGKADKGMPIKNNRAVEKYGGRKSPNSAYAILIREKKKEKLASVSIMQQAEFENNPEAFVKKYFGEKVSLIRREPFKKYQPYILPDGRWRMLASFQEAQKVRQFAMSIKEYEILHKALKKSSSSFNEVELLQIGELMDKFYQYILEDELLTTDPQMKLGQSIEKFKELQDSSTMKELLVELMNIVRAGATKKNNITGRPRYRGEKYISPFLKSTLVYQSITGLYETRRTLDNGLENGSC